MGWLSKSFSLLIILILAVSSIIMVVPAFAQPTAIPHVPEFSVTYVDSNPPAVVLTIQNIPFTSYLDANHHTISMFFNIRTRQGGWGWFNLTDTVNGYPTQDGTENTVITFTYSSLFGFYEIDRNRPELISSEAALAPGYQTDFQLQTMIGYIARPFSAPFPGLFWFYGSTSDWSPIQTLTVPDPSATPAPTPTPTPSPTLTPAPTPTPSITGSFIGSNATLLGAVVIVAVIAIGAGLLIFFKKRKH
jgi:hypothetical protein